MLINLDFLIVIPHIPYAPTFLKPRPVPTSTVLTSSDYLARLLEDMSRFSSHQGDGRIMNMSENHLPNHGHPSSAVRRGNIKTVSHLQTKAQWKDIIRRGCLQRAKIARRQRLQRSRLHDSDNDDGIGLGGYRAYDPPLANNIYSDTCNSVMVGASKRSRDESHSDWNINEYSPEGGGVSVDSHAMLIGKNDDPYDRDVRRLVTGISERNAVDTARALVELEMKCALSGIQHHQQIRPLDGGAPRKKTHDGGALLREANDFEAIEDTDNGNIEKYTMSHEEFSELLNDVTEELQKDGECLHY